MVKPKRSLADDFAPRESSTPSSIKETLAPNDPADPLRHLTVQIPESLRHRVKAAALEEKQSVRDLVTLALQRHLDELGR